MTTKQKKNLIRIAVALVLFLAAWLSPLTGWWQLGAFLVPYFIVGWDVLWRALRNLFRGEARI